MSEVRVNKLSPRSGTTVILGDSGDTISIPSGVTLSNAGTNTFASATITGDLTVDTDTLYVDSTNNKVGIGTSSPTEELTISSLSGSTTVPDAISLGSSYSNTAGTPSKLKVKVYDAGGDNANGLGHSAALMNIVSGIESHSIGFFTTPSGGSSTERMRIDSSGYVGIGTSSPSSSWSSANNFVISDTSSVGVGMTILTGTSATASLIFADGTGGGDNTRGGIQYLHSDNSMRLRVNNDSKLTIDSSGNVGIGTTSAKGDDAGTFAPVLTVNGGSYDGLIEVAGNRSDAADAGVARLQFIQNSNSATYKEVAEIRVETEGATANQRGGRINFRTRANGSTSTTEAMRIDSSGNVGIGRTNPSEKLHVNGSIAINSNTKMISVVSYYSSGYTGDHFIFETTGMMSWCFDGVLQVQGSGSSGYGAFIQHIKIVYSRESGALDTGDPYRQGDSVFNTSTLAHGSVGLNPSQGTVGFVEVKDPDGASSEKSYFKITFNRSGQGVGVDTRLMGTVYYSYPSITTWGLKLYDKDFVLKADIA